MKKLILAIIVLSMAIASCSKKTAGTATTTTSPMPDGIRLFANNCQGCHGAEGVTDGNVNLQTSPMDKAALVHVITKGHGHMPAFEDKLSATEISAIADLIVSWHK